MHCRAEMQEGNFCWGVWETGPQGSGFLVHIGRLDTRHSGSQPRQKPPPHLICQASRAQEQRRCPPSRDHVDSDSEGEQGRSQWIEGPIDADPPPILG